MVAQLELESSKNKNIYSEKLSELTIRNAGETARLNKQLGHMIFSIVAKQSELAKKIIVSPDRSGRHTRKKGSQF